MFASLSLFWRNLANAWGKVRHSLKKESQQLQQFSKYDKPIILVERFPKAPISSFLPAPSSSAVIATPAPTMHDCQLFTVITKQIYASVGHCTIRLVHELLSFMCYDLVVSFLLTSKQNESQGLVQIPSVLQFDFSANEARLCT